jgi:fibronectin type 3 domain-containing protein/lysophospholipase L1-like esterase
MKFRCITRLWQIFIATKQFLFAAISVLAIFAMSASAAPNGSLSDTNIKYFGRWDFSSPSQYVSQWGGAYIKVNFSGTTVQVKLGNTSYFDFKIDGGAWTTLTNVGSGSVNLTPTPLTNGVHTLSVAQGKDYDYVFKFQGLTLSAGGVTTAPAVSTNLIEFIGDSITTGYTDPQANVSDYGWVAAEKLNCEHTQIAYPGVNLVTGYKGIGMDIQYFKQQSFANTNSPAWTFTNYTPRLVVINLGQNDGGANGVPGAIFQSDYTNFLAGIRAQFPNADIFCMRPYLGFLAAQTQGAVNARKAMGDAKVHYVDTTGWLNSGDYNDGVHPSPSGHIKAANFLKAILTPYLGGDVVGKVTVGYQGWFSTAGDGSPVNGWGHDNLEMWPDCREYAMPYAGCPFSQGGVGEPAFFGNLGNGQPATMFSAYDQQVVNTHFNWMAQNDIDCAALQRFANEITPGSTIKAQRDGMAIKVMNAALATGRKFFIEYDASGHSTMDADIKLDWTNTIVNTLHLTSSPAYAHQNGKPVVGVYGMGYATAPNPGPGSTNDCMDLINFLKAQGCYVMGGVPGQWRTGTGDSAPNFMPVYQMMDLIGPWAVGRATDSGYLPYLTADFASCNSNGMDYLPNAYPGTSFFNSNGSSSPKNQFPRNAGNFLWTQLSDMASIHAPSVFIAMFDEMNEATPIFKCAEDASMIPTNNWFLTLDADGTHCSSDFYLRLVKDGGDMLKGLLPLTFTRPTQPVLPATLPNAPLDLVTAGTNTQIMLNWAASPGADSYKIKRSTTSGGSYTVVASNIGHLGYVDTGLVNGTTYYYVVSAVNAMGETANSIEASGKPAAGVASASSQNAPSQGAAQAFDGSTSTKWFNNNAGTTGWLQYYFGGPTHIVVGYALISASDVAGRDPKNWQFQGSADGSAWVTLDTQTAQTFASRGLTKKYTFANTNAYAYYRLNVTANNGDASGIQLAEMSFTYGAAAPTGVGASAFSTTQIVVNWAATSGASSYNIKRATSDGGPYVTIATNIVATFYWDNSAVPNTTYYYVVSAVDGAGNESGNSLQSDTTSLFPGPATPTGLAATPANAQAGLSWMASAAATTYNVKRSTTNGGPYAVIATGITGTSYNDSGLTNGTTYFYVVSAVNTLGESADSISTRATPLVISSGLSFTSGFFSDNTVLGLVGTPGQEVYGVSLGDATARTTANGYSFGTYPSVNLSYGLNGSPYTAFLSGGGTTGDANFDSVLNYGELGLNSGTLVLSNLVAGRIYKVLFLEADTRSSVGTRVFTITSGQVSSPSQSYAFVAGTPHMGGYILGNFTATASTQSFNNTAINYGYQLDGRVVEALR